MKISHDAATRGDRQSQRTDPGPGSVRHRGETPPHRTALLATGTIGGCSSEKEDSRAEHVRSAAPSVEREARAQQVADAWDGSIAAEAWRKGYYPTGEAIQLPDNGLSSATDKRAYEDQNFLLRGNLPAATRKDGQVTWKGGGSITLPLVDARAACGMDRNGSGAPYLTVTGARLGEMTVATSRGPATVPAWLFALEGYDTALKRMAVSPSKLPESPIKQSARVSSGQLLPLGRLVGVADACRTVTVPANHGSCDDGPGVDVLETNGSVVLSAFIVEARKGPWTGEMNGESVTVVLNRPVGSRVMLDAFTGRPVPFDGPNSQSPSWR
ncbi:hypothetical protein GCM10010377_48140 [Streptomyces viridiviolaceus]|uniref:Lipoprotein n=1 Tax=Streptomyces viridiviolaceus TaxID=68282 RepID=A0ABW2E481_9ACTN|nr:hypothetical protein [Streptomyces viridiviolaceus]GHB51472.1 hypothetical protein GCM10010377_48140 [Streptomyces viridiviolaceus]